MKREIKIPPKIEIEHNKGGIKFRYVFMIGIVLLVLGIACLHYSMHHPNVEPSKTELIVDENGKVVGFVEKPLTGEYQYCPLCGEVLP